MSFTPLPGVSASFSIASTKYAFDTVKFQAKAKVVESTNFNSQANVTPVTIAQTFVSTVVGGKINVSGPWDGGAMNSIIVGTTVNNVQINWSATLSTICTCIIEEVNAQSKVDDIARVEDLTLQITGPVVASLL